MAPPRFTPTPEQRALVQNLSAIACTQQEILECVPWGQPSGKPIDQKTLLKYFQPELERGKALSLMRLKKTAFELAADGDRTMLIFLLKTQCHWSETVKIEQTGKDGAPLAMPAVVAYLPTKDPAPEPIAELEHGIARLPAKDAPLLGRSSNEPPTLPAWHQGTPDPGVVTAGTTRSTQLFPAAADPRRGR